MASIFRALPPSFSVMMGLMCTYFCGVGFVSSTALTSNRILCAEAVSVSVFSFLASS